MHETLRPMGMVVPDAWQRDAVEALRQGSDVIVDAPTGAGKTRVFELLLAGRGRPDRSIYTVPTRALANDKLIEWRRAGLRVGISTGDLSEETDAPVVVATLETLRSPLLRGEGPDLLVLDEYQMLGDSRRGLMYELAVALAPYHTKLLFLSGSVANPGAVADWLTRLGRNPVVVRTSERPVPLEEVALESLPGRIPERITCHWPRHIARTILNGLAPVLVFAPRRAAAERLARDLAARLPLDKPLRLSDEQMQLAGRDLARLLHRRIAYHHSGLSYAQRAGLVEPLAKAGQLRVVVATTGLAAGVNFSLRSVIVTDTRFIDRGIETEVAPHELLQMFGRAGRRGIDERGFNLFSETSARPSQSRPLVLRGRAELDWANAIRVLGGSAETSDRPAFASLAGLVGRLFSQRDRQLGFENALADGPRACGLWVDAERARHVRPSRKLILNSNSDWEAAADEAPEMRPISELLVHSHDGWIPFRTDEERMRQIGQGMRFLGQDASGNTSWLRRVILGRWKADHLGTRLLLSPGVKKILAAAGGDPSPLDSLDGERPARLMRLLAKWTGGTHVRTIDRDGEMVAEFDHCRFGHPGVRDSLGCWLVDPPVRMTNHPECAACPNLTLCPTLSGGDTPANLWRGLGLVAPDGRPTIRGRIFSFFNGTEGFAIAVALEHPRFTPEEIIREAANLRAGPRFSVFDTGASSRFIAAAHAAAGGLNAPGLLEHGLPPAYGAGAAEALIDLAGQPARIQHIAGDDLSDGDVERARLEWRSLLRHIARAPEIAGQHRWNELRHLAAIESERIPTTPSYRTLPPLTGLQLQRHEHRL